MTGGANVEKKTQHIKAPNGMVRCAVNTQTLELDYLVIEVQHNNSGSTIAQGDAYSGSLQLLQDDCEKLALQVAEDITFIRNEMEGWRTFYDDKRHEREMDALDEIAASEEEARDDS